MNGDEIKDHELGMFVDTYPGRAVEYIKRLRAERDALKADNARLRAIVERVRDDAFARKFWKPCDDGMTAIFFEKEYRAALLSVLDETEKVLREPSYPCGRWRHG